MPHKAEQLSGRLLSIPSSRPGQGASCCSPVLNFTEQQGATVLEASGKGVVALVPGEGKAGRYPPSVASPQTCLLPCPGSLPQPVCLCPYYSFSFSPSLTLSLQVSHLWGACMGGTG